MHRLIAAEHVRLAGIAPRNIKQNTVLCTKQELEKRKAPEDASDHLNTMFPCHLTPRQQAGLTKLVD